MEGSVIDLSKYRFESAKEDLETARSRIKDGKFKASVNRCNFSQPSCGNSFGTVRFQQTFWCDCFF